MRTAAWVDAYVRSEMWHCRSECAFCACMSLHRGTMSSVCLSVCVTECAAIYMYETNVIVWRLSHTPTSVWVFFFFYLDAACTFLCFIMRARFISWITFACHLICLKGSFVLSTTLTEQYSWGGMWRLSHKLTTFGCESLSHSSERHLKTLNWHLKIALHTLLTTNKLLHEWLINFVKMSSQMPYCIDLLSLID